MSKLTQKAQRCTIKLGTFPLEVFMLEDGNNVLSRTQVLSAVEANTKDLPRWLKSKGLDALPHMGLNLPPFTIRGGKVKPLTIEQAMTIWVKVSAEGNEKATLLLIACATEAIERRADKEFGRVRTEEERNDRLQARVEGWTLAIAPKPTDQ